MGRITDTKKFRRDICATLGHEYVTQVRKFGLVTETWDLCSRCKKSVKVFSTQRVVVDTFPINDKPKIKWSEMYTKRFNPLERAKERIDPPEEL